MQYVLVGHITADLVGDERHLGGTVAYATSIASAFGAQVSLLTSAAHDEPLLQGLEHVADIVNVAAPETTTFINAYGDGKRQQFIYATGGFLNTHHLPKHWLNAPLVHFAPLVDEVDLMMIHDFEQATTMLTLQGCLRQWDETGRVCFRPWFDEAVLRSVDIVVLSRQDIEAMPELESAYAAVANHLIVTDGKYGGTYYQRGRPSRYMALPASEVDPTGAGDVFAATVLASLPHVGYRVEQAVKVAAFVASVSVEHKKASIVYADELIQQALAYAIEVDENKAS